MSTWLARILISSSMEQTVMPFVLVRFDECELDDNWVFADKAGSTYVKVVTWTEDKSQRFRTEKDQAGLSYTIAKSTHHLKFKSSIVISLADNILCYNKEDVSNHDIR